MEKKHYKSILLIVAFLSATLFTTTTTTASTANVIFIYNVIDAATPTVDIEVVNQTTTAQISKTNGVNCAAGTGSLSVPSSTLLTINFYKTGTTTVYNTTTNIVFSDGGNYVSYLFGTSSAKSFGYTSHYATASTGTNIRYDFLHSTNGLQEIDLGIRETSGIIANDLSYTGKTSISSSYQSSASDYTLDITPYNNDNSGLFAYLLPGSTLGGEYIFLFTSGTSSAPDLYMVETDATITKLTSTTALVETTGTISAVNHPEIKVYPNPVTDNLFWDIPNTVNNLSVKISDLSGVLLYTADVSNMENKINLEKLNLRPGMYTIQLINNNETTVRSFMKQ